MIPGTEVQQPAVDGGTLQLTINRDLQWYLQQLIAEQAQDMAAQSGGDHGRRGRDRQDPRRGRVPDASTPTTSTRPTDADRGSRIFRDSFEPGSTFKALTAATVIDAGGQTPTSTVIASGDETFAERRAGDATRSRTPPTPTRWPACSSTRRTRASRSSARRSSAQTRVDYLTAVRHRPGQRASASKASRRACSTRSSEWDNQTVYNTALRAGPDHDDAGARGRVRRDRERRRADAALDRRVVHQGRRHRRRRPSCPSPTRVVSESTSRAGARDARERRPAGELRKAIEIPGYRIAGKTGTGEKSDGNGGYKSGVYFTTMIGFAPAEDPQYVVVVTLDEPTKVTSSAANATGVPEGHDPGSEDLPRHALDDGADAAPQVRREQRPIRPENPMIALTLSQLAHVLDGELHLAAGDTADTVVSGAVDTDSRLIEPGGIFVAKPGEETDGHLFVDAAVANGAARRDRRAPGRAPRHADRRGRRGRRPRRPRARRRRARAGAGDLRVVGITGSNGKTTTKNLLARILEDEGETVSPRGVVQQRGRRAAHDAARHRGARASW